MTQLNRSRPNFSQWLSWLLLAAVVSVLAWLGWRCHSDASFRFLPGDSRAEWIIYPNTPDISAHPVAKPGEGFSTVFRRSIVLDEVPSEARVELRALESFILQINGQPIALPAVRTNWKQASTIDIGRWLVRGTNHIEVSVTNRAGLPALWFVLSEGPRRWSSDNAWESSYAGAVWQPAQLAATPRPIRPGNLMHNEHSLGESLRRAAPTQVVLLLLAVVSCLLMKRWMNERQQPLTERETVRIAMGGLLLLWAILFFRNATQVSPLSGFDVRQHLGYIKFVQDNHQLPHSGQGWETHQPPLYYVLCAAWLHLLQSDIASPFGVAALRLLSFLAGAGQILLVFASLRLIFSGELRRPLFGTAMAAFLPAHLYHAHYITNEMLVAVLVSGVIFLTLRLLRAERSEWWLAFALGVCLGAALLTKLTALLAVPVVLAAIAVRLIHQRAGWRDWLGKFAIVFAATTLVCGWYYWRLWKTGGPWNDPRWAYGTGWWQEDSFRTAAYYFRFGESLARPLFSGFHSFWDGIYSTLWGDGLCGGSTSVDFRPPWDYDGMTLGYLLALLPSMAIMVGLGLALWMLLRRVSLEWFVLLGITLLFGLALLYFSLTAPGTSQVRASFGLILLIPFCALFALGIDRIASIRPRLSIAFYVLAMFWALNSFFAHWISGSSAQSQVHRAKIFFTAGRYADAAREAAEGLRRDPSKSALRSMLADCLNQSGQADQAKFLVQQALLRWPNDPLVHLDVSFDLMQAGAFDQAVAEAQRAIALAPDHVAARKELVSLRIRQGRLPEALVACREALRTAPFDAQLQAWLKDLAQGKPPMATP
jgi:hypothetical protein